MSINLQCDEMPFLPQIGTLDTLLILSYDNEGESDGGQEGVARRLVLFLRSQRQTDVNRAAKDPTEQKDTLIYWDTLIQNVLDVLNEQDTLNFYRL